MWTVSTVSGGVFEGENLKDLANEIAIHCVQREYSSVPAFESIHDENDEPVSDAEVSAFYDEVEELAVAYQRESDAENADYDSLRSSRYA